MNKSSSKLRRRFEDERRRPSPVSFLPIPSLYPLPPSVFKNDQTFPVRAPRLLDRNMAELKLFRGEYYLWHYVPSKVAAIIFALLFAALSICLLWKMIRSKTWFSIPFVIGTFCTYHSFDRAARVGIPANHNV